MNKYEVGIIGGQPPSSVVTTCKFTVPMSKGSDVSIVMVPPTISIEAGNTPKTGEMS